jgi:hypothetical protein
MEALEILNKIKEFCNSIDLNLSETKTKLTHISTEPVLFLGTHISRSNKVSFSRMGINRRLRRNKLGIRLEAPMSRIKDKLTIASFIKEGKSAPKFL